MPHKSDSFFTFNRCFRKNENSYRKARSKKCGEANENAFLGKPSEEIEEQSTRKVFLIHYEIIIVRSVILSLSKRELFFIFAPSLTLHGYFIEKTLYRRDLCTVKLIDLTDFLESRTGRKGLELASLLSTTKRVPTRICGVRVSTRWEPTNRPGGPGATGYLR